MAVRRSASFHAHEVVHREHVVRFWVEPRGGDDERREVVDQAAHLQPVVGRVRRPPVARPDRLLERDVRPRGAAHVLEGDRADVAVLERIGTGAEDDVARPLDLAVAAQHRLDVARIPSTRGIFSTAAWAVAIPFQSTAGADGSGGVGVGDGSGST